MFNCWLKWQVEAAKLAWEGLNVWTKNLIWLTGRGFDVKEETIQSNKGRKGVF